MRSSSRRLKVTLDELTWWELACELLCGELTWPWEAGDRPPFNSLGSVSPGTGLIRSLQSCELHDHPGPGERQEPRRAIRTVSPCSNGQLLTLVMRMPSHLSQRIHVEIHGFVKRFIMPPNFGPAPAPLRSDKSTCYFSIRSGPSAGFLSPPAPRGSTGSELLFRVRFNPPMLSG